MFLESERRQVAAIGRRMSAEGLSNGTSGNLSIYVPKEGYMVLSPSGMRYEDIQPEDVVVMTLEALQRVGAARGILPGKARDPGRGPHPLPLLHHLCRAE